MRLLFVHDRFGAMAGAEVNIQLTAGELQARGHTLGLIHGPSTGKSEAMWNELFSERFSLTTELSRDSNNRRNADTSLAPPKRGEGRGEGNSIKLKSSNGSAHDGPDTSSPRPSPPFHMEERGKAAVASDNYTLTRNAIDTFRPDAIYVHKMADLGVLEALADCGIPVVRMVHDHDLYCMRSYRYSPFTRKICTRAAGWGCVFPCGAVLARDRNGTVPFKWVSYRAKRRELQLNRRFARMIVATGYMREELLRNGFEAAQIEIHAPVPRTSGDAVKASFSDRNRIIYSGQIIRGKGVDVLLEALAKVRVRFECLIFGDGNHRTYCEDLSRELGLNDRVHFKGYQSPDEVDRHYADASLAVVSSVWPEPFGAVGLEAMRHGLPVVAFDAGGIREWLHDGENGFLVPWMDCKEFAARVEQLLSDKAVARGMGESGRRIAQEKFHFDRYISGLEEMFARITGKEALCNHG